MGCSKTIKECVFFNIFGAQNVDLCLVQLLVRAVVYLGIPSRCLGPDKVAISIIHDSAMNIMLLETCTKV